MKKSVSGEYSYTKNNCILFSDKNWNNVLSYLNEKEKLIESVETRKEQLKERTELSKKIIETWNNSTLNEIEKTEQRKKDKIKYENQLKRLELEKQVANQKIIDQTKQALKRDRDGWKTLDSALRLSETLRERQEQLKFKEKIQQLEKENDQVWKNIVINNAKEYTEEKNRERQERVEKKNEKFKIAQKSLNEIMKQKETERMLQIQNEIKDVQNIVKEMKKNEQKEKANKETTKKLMNEIAKENARFRNQKKQKEKHDEEIEKIALHIVKHTKKLLTEEKIKITQERNIAEMERRNQIHKHLSKMLEAKIEDDEGRIKRDLERAEAEYNRKQKDAIRRRQKLADEKFEYFKEYLKDLAIQEKEEKEEARIEFEEKCKLKEYDNIREKIRIENEKQKKIDLKTGLDKLVIENQFYSQDAKLADEIAIKRSELLWKKDDEDFLKYASQVRKECVDKGRPLLPVDMALENYKKQHNLSLNIPANRTYFKTKSFSPSDLLKIRKKKYIPSQD